MPRVSVVVAAYNSEEYLRKCLDSIVSQTYKDLELILVDDGSTDSTSLICDEYASKDQRIKVIHQKNTGSFAARYEGYKVSSGEYIIFLDADDYIDADFIEHLADKAIEADADIVITGFTLEEKGSIRKVYNNLPSGIYKGKNLDHFLEKAMYIGKFYETGVNPTFWNKFIARRIMTDDYVDVKRKIRMGEDAAVVYPLMTKANCIVVDNEYTGYHYIFVEGSMSRIFYDTYFDESITLINGLYRDFSKTEKGRLMTGSLSYYALFIMLLKSDILFSKRVKLPFSQKKTMIRRYLAGLEIDMDPSKIDWSQFKEEDKKKALFLLKGREFSYFVYMYLLILKKRMFS